MSNPLTNSLRDLYISPLVAQVLSGFQQKSLRLHIF